MDTAEDSNVRLPKKAHVPFADLYAYSTLITGEKKIGKTSMFQHAPDVLYLCFEPGARGLAVHQMRMGTWVTFKKTLKLLHKDTKFKLVIIDTVDIAYKLCFDYMCALLVIEHPHDENDFGKSWGKIEKEFSSTMKTLLELEKGVILLGHAHEKEVEDRNGQMHSKMVPTMAKQAASFLEGTVDIWAYYGYDKDARYMYLRGSDSVNAGCRLERNFLDAKTKKPIEKIHMGGTSKQAYENFTKAFANLYAAPVQCAVNTTRRRRVARTTRSS